jgi:single-strand DNA-binding protein
MQYNRVMLGGNLTRDPVKQIFPNKVVLCDIGIAVNRRWRDQEGNEMEEVTFVDCVAFSRTAELITQYFKKGDPIFVEGRLRLEQWEKDGQKRSKIRVVIENFRFVGKKSDDEGAAQNGGTSSTVGREDDPTSQTQPSTKDAALNSGGDG